MNNVTTARLQFATWLKQTNPALFDKAIRAAEKNTRVAMGDYDIDGNLDAAPATPTTTQPSFWSRFTDGLTQLATASIALRAQRAVLNTNIQRAEQGLPPISMESGAPVIRTQIDVSPQVASRLQQTAAEGTQKLLLFGGLAAAAFFLLRGRR
jgi:hypothetical protein